MSSAAPSASPKKEKRMTCEVVVEATHAFKAMERHQLSFENGDKIVVLEKDPSGWWIGKNIQGKVGLIPSPFVKETRVPYPKPDLLEEMCVVKEAISQSVTYADGIISGLGKYVGQPEGTSATPAASSSARPVLDLNVASPVTMSPPTSAGAGCGRERSQSLVNRPALKIKTGVTSGSASPRHRAGSIANSHSAAGGGGGGGGGPRKHGAGAAVEEENIDDLLAMTTLELHDEYVQLTRETATLNRTIRFALQRIARMRLRRKEAEVTGDKSLIMDIGSAKRRPAGIGGGVGAAGGGKPNSADDAAAALALATNFLFDTSAEEMETQKRTIMARRLETAEKELRELSEREELLMQRLKKRAIPTPPSVVEYLRLMKNKGLGANGAKLPAGGGDDDTATDTASIAGMTETASVMTSASKNNNNQQQEAEEAGDPWLDGIENPSLVRYLKYLQSQFNNVNAKLDDIEMELEALATKHKTVERAVKEKSAALEALDAKAHEEASEYVAEWQRKVEAAKAAYDRAKEDATGDGGVARLTAEIEEAKKKIEDGKAAYVKCSNDARDLAAELEELQKHSELQQKADECRKQIDQLTLDERAAEQSYKDFVASIRTDMGAMVQQYKQVEKQRRETYNKIQDLKGNLRVYCRIKPLAGNATSECVSIVDDMTIRIKDLDTEQHTDHEFDLVIGPNATQEEIFEEAKPLATSVLDGYNVCIFAYGQTGSGKTYTMEGPPNNRGINYRTVKELFQVAKDRSDDYQFTLSVSVMEIYNDKAFDLSNGKTPCKIRWAGDDVGVVVEPLAKKQVNCADDVQNALDKAYANRSIAGTNMNAQSSRSHCILTVYVTAMNLSTNTQIRGKLHLIDLAGSERIKQSGVEGDRLKEAAHINISLTHLKTVIQALANKKGFVSYRNSTLTSLLQDSLGGNCKCLMFAAISGETKNVPESVCTIKYAAEARKVEVGKVSANVRKT